MLSLMGELVVVEICVYNRLFRLMAKSRFWIKDKAEMSVGRDGEGETQEDHQA